MAGAVTLAFEAGLTCATARTTCAIIWAGITVLARFTSTIVVAACRNADIVHLVTSLSRAGIAASLTGPANTRFRAIAEGPVVTLRIGFAFVACIPRLITVLRTGIATRLTPLLVIAGFGAITEEAVIAEHVIGYVIARVGAFIARISSAGDTIVTIDICASLADTADTGLGTVAVKSIVTVTISETVDALIPCLVTSLSRAGITTSLTGPVETRFRAIAKGPIVTLRVVGTPSSLNISCNGICPCA
jgi:hypothetical protein